MYMQRKQKIIFSKNISIFKAERAPTGCPFRFKYRKNDYNLMSTPRPITRFVRVNEFVVMAGAVPVDMS